MSNHKRKKTRRQRAGCKMCKPWKMNGVGRKNPISEAFSDFKRRKFQGEALAEYLEEERGST